MVISNRLIKALLGSDSENIEIDNEIIVIDDDMSKRVYINDFYLMCMNFVIKKGYIIKSFKNNSGVYYIDVDHEKYIQSKVFGADNIHQPLFYACTSILSE